MIFINNRFGKHFNFNKKYLKISIYILAVAFLCIAFEKLLDNFAPITSSLGSAIGVVKSLIQPFIYGFFIAYFFNPLVNIFEKKLFGRISFFKSKRKSSRMLAILLTYVIVIGGTIWILYYIIPEIFMNIANLISKIPADRDVFEFDKALYSFIEYVPFIEPEPLQETINSLLEPAFSSIQDLPAFIQTFVNGSLLAAANVAKFLFGILLAFYMLYEKDNFLDYCKKVIYVMFIPEKAEFILYNLSRINVVYVDFIFGKAIDSLIIGIICFVGTVILRMPYALLISIIVGVTNMIPYFGPVLGAIPSVAIVFFVNPLASLILAIFILALQQFDGNILGPKILSISVGLSPLWILFSITVGGAIGGVIGMFLGVPTVAVIKMFADEELDKQYKLKFSKPAGTEAVKEEKAGEEE